MMCGPKCLLISTHMSAQCFSDLQKTMVLGVEEHFSFNSSASCLHNVVMEGHGCTESIILGLSGDSPITVGLSIARREVTHSNVFLVAVTVSAKMLTLSGNKLLTFPNLANKVRNSSPLDKKIQLLFKTIASY